MDDFGGQNLYELFKQQVFETLNQNFLNWANSAETQGVAEQDVRNLRLQWQKIVSETIDKNFEGFRVSLSGKILELLAQSNPYAAIEGGKIGVLPEGTRFWFRGNQSLVAVIEQKPQIRTLRFQKAEKASNEGEEDVPGWPKHEYRLSLPYVIFILTFGLQEDDKWRLSNWNIAFSKKPLRSQDDILYQAALPDCRNLAICMGNHFNIPKAQESIGRQVEAVLDYYWGSYFRPEWMENFVRLVGTGRRFLNLEQWERESLNNPMLALEITWIPEHSIISHIAQMATQHDGLLQTNLPNKIVNSAIADAWEKVQDNTTGQLRELESCFIKNLSHSVTTITNKIVVGGINGMDIALETKRAKIKEDLSAQGYRQTDYLPLSKDVIEINPPRRPSRLRRITSSSFAFLSRGWNRIRRRRR